MTELRSYDEQPRDLSLGTTVLIVDDEEDGRNRLKIICEELSVRTPIRILTASTIAEAIKTIFSTPVHVVLLDKNFENGAEEEDGIEAVPHMLQIQPLLQVLVVTASNATQDIVRAIQFGAFGYITKENSNKVLVEQVHKVVETARLVVDKARLEASVWNGHEVPFITNSKASKRLDAVIHAVAESDRPVLLLGESGTGKTTIAKLIHELRKKYLKQNDRPFFNLNLAALSPSLIERELFGNEVGAFTGAVKMKQGFFELGNGGTIFLDEIAEISLDIQKKLLKVLREGVFQRLGGTREIRTSFKLICATNQNLEEMVANKSFREDLYYRIATFPVNVPSLRDRRQDIPEIIKQLLPTICRQNHVYIKYEDLPKEFITSLKENPPPGNITGLEHKISQLLILSPKDKKGTPILTGWRDIPLLMSAPTGDTRTSITLREFDSLPLDVIGPGFPGIREFLGLVEEKVFADADRKCNGKNRAIASALKISESVISTKVKLLKERRNKEKRLAARATSSNSEKEMEMLQ